MREICFVLTGERILRVYAGSPSRVPDSRDRWNLIWKHREEITEIVHTHPGGFLDFSQEDLTTMEAVESGTGREFAWSVVTRDGYRRRQGLAGTDQHPSEIPWWMTILRELSFYQIRSTHNAPLPRASPKPNPRKEAKKPHEPISPH